MRYYTFNINDLDANGYENEYALLGADDKARIDRKKNENDKKRTVAARMLTRRSIAKLYGISEGSIEFDTYENGKPFVKGGHPEISISHSGDIVAIAISDAPIGIDIEEIRTVDLSLMKRFFKSEDISYVLGENASAEDYGAYSSLPVLTRFFEIWTKKEAASKLDGRGISAINEISLEDYSFQSEIIMDGKYIVSVCFDN